MIITIIYGTIRLKGNNRTKVENLIAAFLERSNDIEFKRRKITILPLTDYFNKSSSYHSLLADFNLVKDL